MEFQFFVGIDIAAATFTASAGTAPWRLVAPPTEFAQDPAGFEALGHWLAEHDLAASQTVCCLEATGVYGEALAYWLAAHHYPVAIEPPLKVKRAFRPGGPKTDAIDSRQIAEYACRYADELTLWQPRPELLEQVQVLLATREQLVNQKTGHQNALRALQRKVVRTPLAEQVYQQLIDQLKQQIQRLEHELQRLIDQDPDLRRTLLLLVSVPGVGLLLAAHLLVLASPRHEPWQARQLAGYVGIAPHPHQSGTSIWKPARSRGYGPAIMRKLLTLAARSVSTHRATFRQYYLRKLAEGKPKSLALNNVANKLVKIICAVLRTGTTYIPNYRSVNPVRLRAA